MSAVQGSLKVEDCLNPDFGVAAVYDGSSPYTSSVNIQVRGTNSWSSLEEFFPLLVDPGEYSLTGIIPVPALASSGYYSMNDGFIVLSLQNVEPSDGLATPLLVIMDVNIFVADPDTFPDAPGKTVVYHTVVPFSGKELRLDLPKISKLHIDAGKNIFAYVRLLRSYGTGTMCFSLHGYSTYDD